MKTIDVKGRPLSAKELGDKLAYRSSILFAVANQIEEDSDYETGKPPNGFLVGALTHACLALCEDIEDVQMAIWTLERGERIDEERVA